MTEQPNNNKEILSTINMFKEQITKMISNLSEKIDSIDRKIHVLGRQKLLLKERLKNMDNYQCSICSKSEDLSLLPSFPIQTKEDFMKLEQNIKTDENTAQQMVKSILKP